MHPSGAYHQTQSTVPWQTHQQDLGTPTGRGHSGYNQRSGTPAPSANAYSNQTQTAPQHWQSGVEGTTSNRGFRPQFHATQGPHPNLQPGYSHDKEHYNPQQFQGHQHGSLVARRGSYHVDEENSEGRAVPGALQPPTQGRSGFPRDQYGVPTVNSGRADTLTDVGLETPSPLPPPIMRRANHSSESGRTTSGRGTSRGLHCSPKNPTPRIHPNNNPNLLRTNSSKSSPPYMLSQRKQLRVEEKSYLKEVKKSIAEGRVPQVRLLQNNNGDIIQYKSQFLNALKLAALSLVPNADIDVKNPSTMQDIMEEVKRQFIIERPLLEGMVEGFLQRLFKRNRAVYHRHWTVHGDHVAHLSLWDAQNIKGTRGTPE